MANAFDEAVQQLQEANRQLSEAKSSMGGISQTVSGWISQTVSGWISQMPGLEKELDTVRNCFSEMEITLSELKDDQQAFLDKVKEALEKYAA